MPVPTSLHTWAEQEQGEPPEDANKSGNPSASPESPKAASQEISLHEKQLLFSHCF